MRTIGWITTIVVGFIVLGALIGGPSRTPTAIATDAPPLSRPDPQIVSFDWQKGGFGVVMVLNRVTISNPASAAVSDFLISCQVSGPSGTVISSPRTRLYERIESGKTRTFRNVNIGFINGQSAAASCRAHDGRYEAPPPARTKAEQDAINEAAQGLKCTGQVPKRACTWK